jgi:hypothetical protein
VVVVLDDVLVVVDVVVDVVEVVGSEVVIVVVLDVGVGVGVVDGVGVGLLGDGETSFFADALLVGATRKRATGPNPPSPPTVQRLPDGRLLALQPRKPEPPATRVTRDPPG